jgi:DNA-binding GntR family transcriptional regulator
MELAALTKGMSNPTACMIERLQATQEEIAEALQSGDGLAYLAADSAFHQTIVDMARNSRLSVMFATLAEQGRCFMLGRTAEAMKKHREEPESHAEILEAIRRKDSARAIDLLGHHFKETIVEIEGMVA